MKTVLSIAIAGVILTAYSFFNFQVWFVWPLPLFAKIVATAASSAHLGFNVCYTWIWIQQVLSGAPLPKLVNPTYGLTMLFLSLAFALPVVFLMVCWRTTASMRARR